MATFKINDWVKITPTPDLRWSEWTQEHNQFCNKVGIIEDIYQTSRHGNLYKVTCNFPNGLEDGSPAGRYYTDFLADHIILSTQYDSVISEHLEKAAKDLNEWEELSRKKTDEMLREIFTSPPRRKRQKKPLDEIKEAEMYSSDIPQPVDFEDITDEVLVPLPGSTTFGSKSSFTNCSSSNDDIDYLLQSYSADDPWYPTQDDFDDDPHYDDDYEPGYTDYED